MPYTFTEFDPSLLPAAARAKIKDIVPPRRKYLGYRATPLIVLHDETTVPLLEVLARISFPSTNWETHEPVWKDTNWHNATPSNIEIIERASTAAKRAGRPPKLNLGVPYGHPDYQRRYHAATIDKQREYRRNRYAKKKAAAVEALDQAGEVKPITLEPPLPATDAAAEEMASRLLGLLPQLAPPPAEKKPTPTINKLHPVFWSDIQKQRAEPFPGYELEDVTGDAP